MVGRSTFGYRVDLANVLLNGRVHVRVFFEEKNWILIFFLPTQRLVDK